MQQKDKVVVIGAGALGLIALKQFKEDGFDVTGYESRSYVGGLWKDSSDSTISVHATTIFNTSKFRAAISDFPFPEAADVYPTAAQMHDYLCSYADHFDLRRHINVNTRVKQILRENDRWNLTVEDVTSGKISTHYFDRVCVATGSFYTPRWPKLEGLEKFAGNVLHSIDFHGNDAFKDQNVLIIGMHATAQDVTNAISNSARHVYLSHRHGLTLLPRFTPKGEAFDTSAALPFFMLQSWFEANMPSLWIWLVDKMLGKVSNAAYPDLPEEWGLRPAPSIAIATPIMADTFWPYLQSGFAEPVAAVKQITDSKTVELTDGRILHDIDSIMYCTGYHFNLPDSLIPKTDDRLSSFDPYPDGPGTIPYLYYNTYPLSTDPAVRNSLAFFGQAATAYPGFVQYELAAMAVSQVWQGNKSLPNLATMKQWHAEHTANRAALAKKYNAPPDSTFYTALLPFKYFTWINETAGTGLFENMGGKLNGMFNLKTWSLWWNDRELYKLLRAGIMSPTVFRVFEAGGRRSFGWEESKKRLRKDNEVYERAVRAKREELGLDVNTGKPVEAKKEL